MFCGGNIWGVFSLLFDPGSVCIEAGWIELQSLSFGLSQSVLLSLSQFLFDWLEQCRLTAA